MFCFIRTLWESFVAPKHAIELICIMPAVNRYDNIVILKSVMESLLQKWFYDVILFVVAVLFIFLLFSG